jgi:hypothetical protein
MAWYVSAHGWGHASRQREVIREVIARKPGIRITVVTGVPAWFWAGIPEIDISPRATGPLPVERGGATDPGATRAGLSDFLACWKELLEGEREFLVSIGAGLVVSDIDAIPFEAARSAGIPAIGLASFTWDWLFGNLPGCGGEAAGLMARLYSEGHYLRLPLGPRDHPFRSCEDMPMLPGGVPADPDRARRLLGREAPLMVVTLRDAGVLEGPLSAPGWKVVTSLPEPMPGCDLNIPPPELERLGLRFADLVACADTVLLTPGYGIVSLVLAAGVRAVVVRRHGFPETPFLMESLEGRSGTVIRNASELTGDGLGKAASLSLEGPAPLPAGAGGIEASAGRLVEAHESGTDCLPDC